ncbi:hypothetical protein BDM02DRAFT_3183550 [Thelephora ganbajun]|uniref:Uncharacterized protein n=1 Tax=Thelephora ganbajun TaxID=370292 RepID=A0ACB6ZSR6_THEGA|nr:hypothetical protein BDM02DRAFT_3183550 [Thelephora ganbajun]
MRIASGSALLVACLVVASSANSKPENASVTLPPQSGGRRVASLGTRKKRGLYGELSIDGAVENVQMRKVTPVLDRLPSRPESTGLESASDRPQELLEDFLHKSIGNLSQPLEDSCTGATPPAPPSDHPRVAQVRVHSEQFAFPSDVCSLDPTIGVHVYPPLYSGPPNTPLIGSAAFFLSNPPLSRALAHCSTSLSIWCSESQKATHMVDPPGIDAKSPATPYRDHLHSEAHSPGEILMSSRVDQAERTRECQDAANSSVGTHIADGGWVSNLVQTLSS